MTSMRYMGTKRGLAPLVVKSVSNCSEHGRAADLFAGMGTVAQALSDKHSVVLNDVMEFPTIFAKAHCLSGTKRRPSTLLSDIYPLFQEHRKSARKDFKVRIDAEAESIRRSPEYLKRFMQDSLHVGNSSRYKKMAERAKKSDGHKHYRLATLYFSSGYFSTAQSIDLDAIRYAIDHLPISSSTANPLLAVWMATASRIINAPGHSAQFLKPTNEKSHLKIQRQMQRNVWDVFVEIANRFSPWGGNEWRLNNYVLQGDALEVINSPKLPNVEVVYADPPYTQDQYSRYYHVFESLLLNDYPCSDGAGRYRNERYTSPFCQIRSVEEAFKRLFQGVKNLNVPLILSYPSDGILQKSGIDIYDFIGGYFDNVKTISIQKSHSTMGASKGFAKKETTENIFTCT